MFRSYLINDKDEAALSYFLFFSILSLRSNHSYAIHKLSFNLWFNSQIFWDAKMSEFMVEKKVRVGDGGFQTLDPLRWDPDEIDPMANSPPSNSNVLNISFCTKYTNLTQCANPRLLFMKLSLPFKASSNVQTCKSYQPKQVINQITL